MATKIGSPLDFGGAARITNLPAPADPNDAARLVDVQSAAEGLAWKDSVRVATQSNIDLSSPGSTLDGVTMASTDRVLVQAQTDTEDNGLYLWNGASSAMTRAADGSTAAELEQAVVTVEEGTSAGATYRQSSVNFTLGTDPVVWATFGTSAPSASTTTPGIVEIATQGEVDTGTDTTRVVTPETLAGWTGRSLRHSASFGDGSATQYDITHNLGTKDLVASIRENATDDVIIADVKMLSTTVTRVTLAVAPTTNALRITLVG